MANQIVQINISQSSSGAPVVVSMTYTSDGYLVTKTRDRYPNYESYTMDGRLAMTCRHELLDQVKKLLAEGQLF